MSNLSERNAGAMRVLHSMLRVSNLERSHSFYLDLLGMRELRHEEYPEGRFTLSFVGYGSEHETSVVELTWNWDGKTYIHGSAFGHIAIGCTDINVVCDRLRNSGVEILREPGPMKYTATNGARDVIAFVKDPDGYQIELVELTETGAQNDLMTPPEATQ